MCQQPVFCDWRWVAFGLKELEGKDLKEREWESRGGYLTWCFYMDEFCYSFTDLIYTWTKKELMVK
jgi:hypothetical protein